MSFSTRCPKFRSLFLNSILSPKSKRWNSSLLSFTTPGSLPINDKIRSLRLRADAVHKMSDALNGCSTSEMLKGTQEERKSINETPLISRQFISCLPNGEDPSSSHSAIRVMQWNILAQGLCRCNDAFILCPDNALEWSYRQNLILEELLTYSPDIICLQEVDNFKFLQLHLQKLGFKGSFFPKPDSPCLYTKDSNGPDGCSIFWNEKKLSLTGSDNLVLNRENGRQSNQVAIVCKFQLQSNLESGNKDNCDFFVTTTHLKSKPQYQKLRFEQGSYFEGWLRDHCHGKPLIVCGDFNAEPSERVIDVFKTSSLGLTSSYTLLSENGSEPPYTTWKVRGNHLGKKEEFCHTIDYLFFTPMYLTCTKILKLPSEEEIGEGRLPSYSYPSDHLSLMADFQLKMSLESPL